MEDYKYEVTFTVSRWTQQSHIKIVDPNEFNINDLKEGFWVNENYDLTKGSDALYFIMPAKVLMVKKVKG